jgi:hypothetical protein
MWLTRALRYVALLTIPLLAMHDSHGAERGFYAGAAFAGLTADYAPPEAVFLPTGSETPSRLSEGLVDSIGSQGLKAVAGYRAWNWLAFEIDYLDLSSDSAPLTLVCVTQPCLTRIRAETSSTSLSALALWPLGRFDLFARAGLSRWKSGVDWLTSDGTAADSQSVHGSDEKFGGGVQLHIHQFTARLEYEHLRFGLDSADSWSLGVAYQFR